MRNTRLKILMTGGHAGSTAYALIEEIRSSVKKPIDMFWVGSKSAVEGKQVPTYEAKVLPQMGVHMDSLITGKIQTKFTFWTLPSLLKIPIGFIHAFIVLVRIHPDIVVSFGGFSAFPIVFNAWLMHVPVIIHEQTIVYGRTNKLSAFFASKIALARPESMSYFPREKCEVTGNPVSKEIQNVSSKKRMGHPPVLFITGGSRGAIAINDIVNTTLPELLNEFKVIHQTGLVQESKFVEKREFLTKEMQERYLVYGFINPRQFRKIITESDIIIARAGANTVSEILIVKRPCLFIPLPFAFMAEQEKNALYAKEFGIAEVLKQEDLTAETFMKAVMYVKDNWYSYIEKTRDKNSIDIDAAKKLLGIINEFIPLND